MCVYELMRGVRLVSWCVGCECRAWVQCVALCACWCVRVVCVLCACCVCGCVLCGVCLFVWHAENLRVCIQHVPVCAFKMSPCVPATCPHVFYMWACCRYTRGRFDRTRGRVECTDGGPLSLSSLFLPFSLSLSLSSSLVLLTIPPIIRFT